MKNETKTKNILWGILIIGGAILMCAADSIIDIIMGA